MVAKIQALPPKPTIVFSDFDKLDLRIGKVVTAERVVKSERLIRLEVDFGEPIGIRMIFAGVAEWYAAEDLIGRKFIFVVNLEPKPMMGSESQGMMLAADAGGRCILLPVDETVPVGLVVR